MPVSIDRLPSRFPTGTRYVVEGRGDRGGRLRIHVRYLEFPDGRHIELPLDSTVVQKRRPSRRGTSRK